MLRDVCSEGQLASSPYQRAASTYVVGAVREPPILEVRKGLVISHFIQVPDRD